MSRDISPPPAKRRKTSPQVSTTQPSRAPEPLPPLEPNNIRIFSWNINSITPFLQKSITSFFPPPFSKEPVASASLRSFLHRHAWPSILLLQEVKIAYKDTKTQDVVSTAINSRLPQESDPEEIGPTYEAHFTLPTDLHNARGPGGSGKVCGVCSILRTDLRQNYNVNVRTVDWDNEGRISVIEIIKKSVSAAKLALFNIYAVNGTSHPYRDPATGAITGTRHDRKRAVHCLLAKECKALEEQGWNVLIGGDINVAPDARDGYPNLRISPHDHVINRADFHDRILEGGTGLNGVDVWRKMHGEERRYTYYPRKGRWGSSCDRVDYFVAGRMLDGGLVRGCGIMNSELEMEPSDHCPIWVDIGFESGEGVGKDNGIEDVVRSTVI